MSYTEYERKQRERIYELFHIYFRRKKAMLNVSTCYVLCTFIRLITHVKLAYLFTMCDLKIECFLVLPSILASIEDVSPLTSSDHGPFP